MVPWPRILASPEFPSVPGLQDLDPGFALR